MNYFDTDRNYELQENLLRRLNETAGTAGTTKGLETANFHFFLFPGFRGDGDGCDRSGSGDRSNRGGPVDHRGCLRNNPSLPMESHSLG